MRKIILIVFLLLFVFQFAFSNEKQCIQKKNNITFIQENKFNNTNIDNFFGKPRRFTGMAIAGTVIFGVSWFFIIPGAALMAYGWANRWVNTHYWSYGSEVYATYEDLTTFYVGVGVLSLGLIVMFTGLPLMIVGWVLRSRSNVSIFIDNDKDRANMGFAVKI